MSYENLRQGMGSADDDDREFREWVESISANRDEVETLVAHPNYSLYQAKEHVRLGKAFRRSGYGPLMLLSRFRGRYTRAWKQLTKTLAEIGHQHRLHGHHETSG